MEDNLLNDYTSVITVLKDAEKVTTTLGIEPFSIYLLGGSACILGNCLDNLASVLFFPIRN